MTSFIQRSRAAVMENSVDSARNPKTQEHQEKEQSIIKSIYLTTSYHPTQRITLNLGWNFNGQDEPARIPASYHDHIIPKWVTIKLNDGYNNIVPSLLLIEYSEYFFRCLEGSWQEASKREVMLDFNIATWCIFWNWLESGIVTSQPPIPSGITLHGFQNAVFDCKINSHRSIDDCMVSIERLTQAWILGDYLLAAQFQNDVVDELTCAYQNFWSQKKEIPWSLLKYTCENTLENSGLHRVVLDLLLFRGSTKFIMPDQEASRFFEKGGFTDYVQLANVQNSVYANGGRRPAPWNRSRTFYHIKPRYRISPRSRFSSAAGC